jgi:hypothetical protein
MSEASGINVSINTNEEEQEEKEVQPEQGDDEGLVNESEGEDEEKQSTSAGNASSRPPQVQVKAVSHSRERNGNENVRLENNRQKARDTRKRKKIMLGEMKRRIVSLQKVNKELQEKNTALQDALDRALQECEAKSVSLILCVVFLSPCSSSPMFSSSSSSSSETDPSAHRIQGPVFTAPALYLYHRNILLCNCIFSHYTLSCFVVAFLLPQTPLFTPNPLTTS